MTHQGGSASLGRVPTVPAYTPVPACAAATRTAQNAATVGEVTSASTEAATTICKPAKMAAHTRKALLVKGVSSHGVARCS